MKKYNLYTLSLTAFLLVLSVLYSSCKRTHKFDKDGQGNPIGNCFDGVKNQNETAVDCGGVCKSCADCSDGVKNGAETGIDCGGSACQSCTPPSSCSSLANQSMLSMGGSTTASVYSAYLNTTNPNNGVATIHIDLQTNAYSISSYDIDLGSQNFASMAVGDQQVYTTVGYSGASTLSGGQAYVLITQGGFSYAQYSSKVGQTIYIKKLSSTTTKVWFCSLYTEDTSPPQNTYNFSLGASF